MNTAHPLYSTWRNMLGRCNNPKDAGYRRYGGRGIKVCKRWTKSFAAFVKDMGPKPSPKHSIDRRNNDGNYKPGNCRWATMKEQQRNRSDNVIITIDERSQPLSAWAEQFGLSRGTIDKRFELGWRGIRLLIPGVHQSLRTHCPKGHEYTEENTTHTQGKRVCRKCNAAYMRRYYDKFRKGRTNKHEGLPRW
jgi:hypothetical protein